MLQQDNFNPSPTIKKRKLNILPENPETLDDARIVGPGRFPSWLHRKLPQGNDLWSTGQILAENRLPTVCEEARCPNLLECWSKKTATFLIMGKECTRACGFCDIDFSKTPKALEEDEPQRVADSVVKLNLKHVVITMVARDDIPLQGANHIAAVVDAVRAASPTCTIELLTSDFNGDLDALDTVLGAKPDIFNHNIETVRALSPRVRHKATYDRTLEILKAAHERRHTPELIIKSGIMVGLGETPQQVEETILDLHTAGCAVITIGQYLQANHNKLRVKEFITPALFKHYEEYGHSIGIRHMYCGPFVRSSYNAALVLEKFQPTE